MTELEKMKAYHAMETIKETPDWLSEMVLKMLCNTEPTGKMERLARILAEYGMDVRKIVPCIMAIMQDSLIDIECDGKSLGSENEHEVNGDGRHVL